MDNNNSIGSIFLFIGFFLAVTGNFPGIFPLAICYFIVKSFLGNQEKGNQRTRGRDTNRDYDRSRRYDRDREREELRKRRDRERTTSRQQYQTRKRKIVPKKNPYKQSGITKFKEYDYDGAIEDFEKALSIDSSDISVHFNLACAYSLNENKDKSFYHLSKAVALGYTDFKKIQEHDALAYLRIQSEFEAFKNNGYRIVQTKANQKKEEEPLAQNADLLEQLNRLQHLRAKGVLTEREFAEQKAKLMR